MKSRYATGIRFILGITFGILLFFPLFIGALVPVRVFAILLGAVLLGWEGYTALPGRKRGFFLLIIALGTAALMGIAEFGARVFDDRLFAVNIQQLFILAPMFGGAAYFAVRRRRFSPYLNGLLLVATVTAVLAVWESFLGASLFGMSDAFWGSQREGQARAVLASEHSIVLGMLFAALVPLSRLLPRLYFSIPAALVLIAGTWATGSRLATLIAAFTALIAFLPVVGRLLQRLLSLVFVGFGIAVFAVGYLAIFVWQREIPGMSGVEYSSNYRWAMYSLLPELLLSRPFGYFFQQAPRGEWTMPSDARGVVDLIDSVDSELVYDALAIGWLGVMLFIATGIVSILVLRRSVPLGLAACTFTGLGFFMAIHSWDAGGNLWYAVMGAVLALLIPQHAAKPSIPSDEETVVSSPESQ